MKSFSNDLFCRLMSHFGWKPEAVDANHDVIKELLKHETSVTKSHVASGTGEAIKDTDTCLIFSKAEPEVKSASLDDAVKVKDRLKINTCKLARQFTSTWPPMQG